MAVSGSGNIPPLGPLGPEKLDPSFVQGKQAEGTALPREFLLSDTGANSAVQQEEGLVRSGSTGMYETESQINKAKYRKTQDTTATSTKARLRGAFSKMRASVQGFLSGFGSRASRVSARRAEAKGEGASLLPTDMEVATKKGNRISPEMQRFFLDASGMGGSSSDISMISLESLKSSKFSPLVFNEEISASEASSIASFGSLQRTETPVTEEKTNMWTLVRLGGEMVSFLLDPNVETSALVRRAMFTGNEGMVDISNLDQQEISTAMTPIGLGTKKVKVAFSDSTLDPTNTQGGMGASHKTTSLENAALQIAKKDSQSQLLEDQALLARAMAGILASSTTGTTFTPLGLLGPSSSTKFPAPKFSGTLAYSSKDKPKHKSISIEKVNTSLHFSSFHKEQRSIRTPSQSSWHTEGRYRFPKKTKSEDIFSITKDVVRTTEFYSPDNSSRSFLPVSKESITSIRDGFGDVSGNDAISSSYHFLAHRGVSLMAPLQRSIETYTKELEKHKGPGAPPDPLIYQYRNVAVEPPLVLHSPRPFMSSSRFSVQGKPEAATVHDDGRDSGKGFSDQNPGGEQSSRRSSSKKKNKKTSMDMEF
ncbi:hypothetical protein [Candidatus Chlamydia sanziniae]|uniref:Uncharacterized protein n=1 Tax=Candidatus Chlamydia sanziniae TaxID=1806891 RepID=A0A1A9HW54_9CHLA|nr:hypothetical protein [Candidatus Chlamydia sanziniae]ANH79075.1 hypothetical protein Cs308_0905 [Candidatus Chlamydia sanziniae]